MGTGVFNKKQGFIKLKGKIERYHIEKKSISITFIDVDKLENINDKLINIIATIIKKYEKRRLFI
ncbi:hypothetical protein ACR77J_03335 [Tissierella praeacuta]